MNKNTKEERLIIGEVFFLFIMAFCETVFAENSLSEYIYDVELQERWLWDVKKHRKIELMDEGTGIILLCWMICRDSRIA